MRRCHPLRSIDSCWEVTSTLVTRRLESSGALRDVRCRRGIVRWTKRHFQCRQSVTDSTRLAAIGSMEVLNPLDRGKPTRRQDMTAAETFTTLRRFWLKLYDPLEVLIMAMDHAYMCVKHQMRLYVCHQMRLYVCHQMRLYVCHQMRLYVCHQMRLYV